MQKSNLKSARNAYCLRISTASIQFDRESLQANVIQVNTRNAVSLFVEHINQLRSYLARFRLHRLEINFNLGGTASQIEALAIGRLITLITCDDRKSDIVVKSFFHRLNYHQMHKKSACLLAIDLRSKQGHRLNLKLQNKDNVSHAIKVKTQISFILFRTLQLTSDTFNLNCGKSLTFYIRTLLGMLTNSKVRPLGEIFSGYQKITNLFVVNFEEALRK